MKIDNQIIKYDLSTDAWTEFNIEKKSLLMGDGRFGSIALDEKETLKLRDFLNEVLK